MSISAATATTREQHRTKATGQFGNQPHADSGQVEPVLASVDSPLDVGCPECPAGRGRECIDWNGQPAKHPHEKRLARASMADLDIVHATGGGGCFCDGCGGNLYFSNIVTTRDGRHYSLCSTCMPAKQPADPMPAAPPAPTGSWSGNQAVKGAVNGARLDVYEGRFAPEIVWSNDANWFRSDIVQSGEPYGMRIQANRPLTPDEVQDLAGLVGYTYRATIRGESIGDPGQDTASSIIVDADHTKSARDDIGMGMEDFQAQLAQIVKEGSPVRKTNRAGAGTKDTRLLEGLGADVEVTIYYDCR